MELLFDFPAEYLRAGLLVSLLSVWLLVGLFAYLNHYTRRRYFTIWTAAWLFYALWLTLNFALELFPGHRFVLMSRQWCVGISAVFLFWGSLVFMGQRVRQVTLGLFMLFLLVWSYVGTYHLSDPLQAQLPVFLMLGAASFRAAFCFFKYRCKRHYIGASLLAMGLLLWGVYLGGHPFWESAARLRAVSFFLCGVIQLFIAVSMIILVLEEGRATLQRVVETNRSNRQACAGLQQQVRSSEDRYRKLFEQASDAIVITGRDSLEILELNQRAKRLLMITRFEPGQQSLRAFLEGHTPSCEPAGGSQEFERIRLHRALHLVAADGTKTPVEAEATAIEFEGQPAYQFAFRELTERVRLEQQLRQSEKLSALGQMISGIAHELNNPLAVIKGYLDLILAHHNLPEHTRSDLQNVSNESSRAARLVKNFLTFAREQPARRVETDLNGMVGRVAELRRTELHHADIDLQLVLDAGLPPVLADPDKIQQVLVNLAANAMHALAGRKPPSGRPVLRITTERFNGLVRLLVEDNGPGVPKHMESRIFEPFFTTKEVGQGTGLGLSIAHSIMAEHGGRIYHRSGSLGGACFVLELPASSPKVCALTTPEPAPAAAPEASVPPARILVLDDEELLADMLGQIVNRLGHRATLCYSPLDALEKIEREHFDLILSDYRMPGLDGRQFYRRVAQIQPDLAARIIFLTGDVVSEATCSFLSTVGNACIAKPFQLRAVENTVTRTLREGRSVSEPAEMACAG